MMTKVSIDMSKNDETYENRIFAEVIEKQTTNDGDVTLLCDFESANYDFDNSEKIANLKNKLEIAVKALITYKNLRYDGTVTSYEYIAKEALAKIKEIK